MPKHPGSGGGATVGGDGNGQGKPQPRSRPRLHNRQAGLTSVPRGVEPVRGVRVDLAAAPRDNVNAELRRHAVPIASLTLDPMNARLHPEENLQAIMESLALFGQVKPVVVRRENGVVMAGNGTLVAAMQLGWTRVAAVHVSMDDATAAAYGLADNRTAELAKWNFEVVAALDRVVREAGLPMVGWTDDELTVMRARSWVEPPPEEFPEVDEGIAVEHVCPRCGYKFSGGDVVAAGKGEADDAEEA